MWVHSLSIKKALTLTLHSRKSGAKNIAHVVTSIHLAERLRHKKHFRSYSKAFNYLLRKFVKDQAIAKIESTFSCYIQLARTNSMQYANSLCATSRKVAGVNDTSTLTDIFIKKVDFSICCSIKKYFTADLEADLTSTASKALSLLAIQKRNTNRNILKTKTITRNNLVKISWDS